LSSEERNAPCLTTTRLHTHDTCLHIGERRGEKKGKRMDALLTSCFSSVAAGKEEEGAAAAAAAREKSHTHYSSSLTRTLLLAACEAATDAKNKRSGTCTLAPADVPLERGRESKRKARKANSENNKGLSDLLVVAFFSLTI
jgi:hypothetical protein